MKSHSSFIFDRVIWNPHARKIVLRYSLDHSVAFEETLILPDEPLTVHLKEREVQIQKALKALHLIGGISYYKTCSPKKLNLGEITLTKTEARFWNTVYERGLGEFFYRNNIDFRGLINFPLNPHPLPLSRGERGKMSVRRSPSPTGRRGQGMRVQRILVPIGGGKDSVVTMELLKKSGANVTLLRMGAHPLIDELAHVAGLPMLTIRRSLSPALFDLNAQGALNGHVPITAYLSILSVLIALLYDFDAIAMSNERSANVGNVIFKGVEINHQWSKSLEFEKMLRTLVKDSWGTTVEYFSALRPFSELKIAEMFSRLPQYFEHVTSCNTNWKILSTLTPTPLPKGEGHASKWCNQCPKCAFVFVTLAAFIPKKTLLKMFGTDLLDQESLIPLYRELLGIANFKPFECVGTPEETRAAFLLARKSPPSPLGRGVGGEGGVVMKMFEKEVLPLIKSPETLITKSLTASSQHFIPASLQSFILGFATGDGRAGTKK